MKTKNRRFTVAVTAFLIIASIVVTATQINATYPIPTASIDVFTQKAPYDGKGPNQPSDMFGPQETVILCALVLVDTVPASGKLVTFEIVGPAHVPTDIKFYQTAETNASGIAETSFSLQVINQTDVFGTWSVIATVEVDGNIHTDTLTFQVNWIIELISVRTLDENLSERTYFGIGGYVGIEISLRNNAKFKKDALIGITIFDELNVPISSLQIKNFTVPPNGKIWYIFNKLFLPKFGVPGHATVNVVALDANNAAYCPKVSATFIMTLYDPISPDFVDAAVYLDFIPAQVEPGETVPITVIARNEGTVTLSDFTVFLYINGVLLNSQFINSLDSYNSQTFETDWNTNGLPEGNYAITASIQPFPNEADLSDNNYTSTVELRTTRPTYFVHDLQVVSVTCSKYDVYQGEIVNIEVALRNNGNATESTNVEAYYDAFLIQEKSVTNLAPATQQVLVFQWNTMNVPERIYLISAIANPVEGETNLADNTYHDGNVRIRAPLPQVTHDVEITALSASPNVTEIGTLIAIAATVKNLGSVPESFNVIFFYDNFPFADLQVDFLAPSTEKELAYTWDTSNMMEGNYTIKAHIPPLPDEQNITNNLYVDGTVWIKAPHPIAKEHNIAITAVSASAYQAYIGDSIEITVKVANLGDFAETTNVTAHANMLDINSRNFLFMEAHSNMTLSFIWNTSNMDPGDYTIWAFADYVPGETKLDDNVFTDGMITLRAQPAHYIHDVAVISVQPQSQSIFVGQELTILAKVKNKGNATESFNVTLYYDSNPIQKITVYSLPPTNEQTLTFQWDTNNVTPGNYTISAYAEPVPEETNTNDNTYRDGIVQVRKSQPSIARDIAVVFLSAEPIEVSAGENVTISVAVLNLGLDPESFNTTIYYGSNLLQVIPVTSLAPYVTQTMTLEWNTRNVKPGVYSISANVTILEGETNTANNSLTYGNVTIRSPPEIPYWALVIPLLAGLAILALLLLLLARRRKKKKEEKPVTGPRYTIVSHPHI
jgi:subtilase family serine protease